MANEAPRAARNHGFSVRCRREARDPSGGDDREESIRTCRFGAHSGPLPRQIRHFPERGDPSCERDVSASAFRRRRVAVAQAGRQ